MRALTFSPPFKRSRQCSFSTLCCYGCSFQFCGDLSATVFHSQSKGKVHHHYLRVPESSLPLTIVPLLSVQSVCVFTQNFIISHTFETTSILGVISWLHCYRACSSSLALSHWFSSEHHKFSIAIRQRYLRILDSTNESRSDIYCWVHYY